jgi:hypothetical protein
MGDEDRKKREAVARAKADPTFLTKSSGTEALG